MAASMPNSSTGCVSVFSMADTIAPLPPAIASYVGRFELTALAVTRDNRIIVTRDPAGAKAAWWCKAEDAGPLLRWLVSHLSHDAPYAARTLRLVVTEHATVVQRAAAAVARIEVGLDRAQKEGLLAQFNRAYKAHRLAAKANGKHFIGYQQAQARLKAALASAAAKGGEVEPAELFANVFSDGGRK
jgi:hypothetical protein